MTAIYVPALIGMCFAKPIMIALGQDEIAVSYAEDYIQPMMLGFFFYGNLDLTRRFLTSLQYSTVPMIG